MSARLTSDFASMADNLLMLRITSALQNSRAPLPTLLFWRYFRERQESAKVTCGRSYPRNLSKFVPFQSLKVLRVRQKASTISVVRRIPCRQFITCMVARPTRREQADCACCLRLQRPCARSAGLNLFFGRELCPGFGIFIECGNDAVDQALHFFFSVFFRFVCV